MTADINTLKADLRIINQNIAFLMAGPETVETSAAIADSLVQTASLKAKIHILTNLTSAQQKVIETLVARHSAQATHEIEEAFGRSVFLTIRAPGRIDCYKVGPRGAYNKIG